MKTFQQLREELAVHSQPEASTAIDTVENTDSEALDEGTVHLKPHGTKGTHFKVVKGIKGHLEAGEVIHDSAVDDLHDMGYKVKHLKEGEEGSEPLTESQSDEYEADLMSEADWKIGAAADKPRTREEEIEIGRGTRYGDYKGHRAAMKKKHGISESLSDRRPNMTNKSITALRDSQRAKMAARTPEQKAADDKENEDYAAELRKKHAGLPHNA